MSEATLVLVIEDEADVRSLVHHALEPKYAVIEERFLATGIRQTRNRKPACIILDLGLPDCQGLQTLRHFLSALPGEIVVIVTGRGDLGVQAIQEGAMDFIEKPFQGDDLRKRVDMAIARAQVRPYHQPIKEQFDSVLGLLEEKKQNDSRCPADPLPTVNRSALTTIRTLALVLLMLASFYAGGEVRERSLRTQAVGQSPASAVQVPSLTPHGLIDYKLAELRTNPGGAAATYFRVCDLDPARRGEVVAALGLAVEATDGDARVKAQVALMRWEK